MANNFGKFCRKLRIDHGELLADMAKKLGVSSAFLSKVENGGKKPPSDWREQLILLYQLNDSQISELDEYLFEAMNYRSLDMSGYSEDSRNMLLSFARKLNSMDDSKKEQLKKLMEK